MGSAAGTTTARRALARHLHGDGLELGPGHAPFPLAAGVRVRYVDRWSPAENQALFPELDDPTFPTPDIVADLDRDRLGAVEDATVDFVVASHVLEHVADPLALLADIHRVLRIGGVALVLLPDRRATFDADRRPTPLDHLAAEHDAGLTAVPDDHIVEFVGATEGGRVPTPAEIDLHRRRSVHAHCWSETEFLPVVGYGVRALGQRWQFVDGLRTGAPHSIGIEFGLVLRKGGDSDAARCAARLDSDWQIWLDSTAPMASVDAADLATLRARVDALESSTSWRITAPLRAVARRRGRLGVRHWPR